MTHVVVSNRTVRHAVGTKICRPIRKPLRCLIKQQFSQGASVFRMRQERLQRRTEEERRGRNYDGIGTSGNTFRKIKSEGVIESLLSPAVDDGLSKLLSKFQRDVNPDGKVKGAIQILSKYPRQVIVFTETSIRLFDTLLKHKNVVVSWDATGSIIKEKRHTNRMLYYELSVTLPGIVNENSIVPITFMISDAHALVNVTSWLESFKDKYAQVSVLLFISLQLRLVKSALSYSMAIGERTAISLMNVPKLVNSSITINRSINTSFASLIIV